MRQRRRSEEPHCRCACTDREAPECEGNCKRDGNSECGGNGENSRQVEIEYVGARLMDPRFWQSRICQISRLTNYQGESIT